MGKFEDLTGQKFGRLTVIERDTSRKGTYWLCQCDCGNDKLCSVRANHLTSGEVKSCGCLRKETTSKNMKKYNQYRFIGDYGIGFTTKNEPFFFDKEDFDKIKNYCWYYNNKKYIQYTDSKNESILFIHNLLMNPPEPLVVDHKDYNPFDNRKSELRICTIQQNRQNNSNAKNYRYRTDNRKKKWEVYIKVNDKIISKSFSTESEAATYAKELQQKYYGEFAPHDPKPLPPELQLAIDNPQLVLDTYEKFPEQPEQPEVGPDE